MSNKRILKELNEVTEKPPAGIAVNLISESDIYKWNVVIDGPAGSQYAGGKFKLLVDLPTNYPFKPPVVNFVTRIYHPNVTFDEKGSICVAILKVGEWKPSSRILTSLQAIQQLLSEPNPDDPLEASIATKYKDDRAGFNKEAQAQTKKHAM